MKQRTLLILLPIIGLLLGIPLGLSALPSLAATILTAVLTTTIIVPLLVFSEGFQRRRLRTRLFQKNLLSESRMAETYHLPETISPQDLPGISAPILDSLNYLTHSLHNLAKTVQRESKGAGLHGNTLLSSSRESLEQTSSMRTTLTALTQLMKGAADTLEEGKQRTAALSDRSSRLLELVDKESQTVEQTAGVSAGIAALVPRVSNTIENRNGDLQKIAAAISETQHRLETSSHRSSEVRNNAETMITLTGTIANIVYETGLLAINASIQAARAGEEGKAFQVIAHSIRELADSSHSHLDEIQKALEKNLSLIQQTSEDTNQIHHEQTEISQAVQTFKQSLQEIAQEMSSLQHQQEELSQSSQRLEDLHQQVSAIQNELTTDSKELSGQITQAHSASIQAAQRAQEALYAAANLDTSTLRTAAGINRTTINTLITGLEAADTLDSRSRHSQLTQDNEPASQSPQKKQPGIHWSDSLSIYNDRVDSQHQGLFNIVDSLLSKVEQGIGREELVADLKHFAQAVQEHFSSEEGIMTHAGYPKLEEHKKNTLRPASGGRKGTPRAQLPRGPTC